MSRHRFLMLGASIVGVGMLPFAQRNYAYAQSIVTPNNYAPRRGFDNTDHTAVLYKMFSDKRLKPPFHFHLPPRPPDPNIPDDPGGWMVNMGQDFTTFPVKSRWTLTGKTLDAGTTLDPETLRRSTLPNGTVLDPASALYRKGELVDGNDMFQNTDTNRGNDDITFSNVYVRGRKHDWAELNGGYFDIDKPSNFLRIYQNPSAASDQWNSNLTLDGCIVEEWPGISCVLYQLDNFRVSNNLVTWSHRGSLIFRFGARDGKVHDNHVLDGGDDCIAFNGNTDNYYEQYPNNPPPKAERVYLWANVLSEKKGTGGVRRDEEGNEILFDGNDIPEPPDGRKRTGNSPLAVRGGQDIYIGASPEGVVRGNEVLYTTDGYTDIDGNDHEAQPAVEVRDMQGQSARNIWVTNLTVQETKAGALVVPSAGVTGGVYDSVCVSYTGSTATEPSDSWKLAPPATIFARENLTPPDYYTP
jgi:hypothetical protein